MCAALFMFVNAGYTSLVMSGHVNGTAAGAYALLAAVWLWHLSRIRNHDRGHVR